MVNRRYQTSGWDYSMYLGWFTDAVTRAMFEKCLALLKEQEKSGKARETGAERMSVPVFCRALWRTLFSRAPLFW